MSIANHTTGPRNNVREANFSPSVALPDKTLSLRDLMARNASGGRVKSFTPQYLGDTTVIPHEFERMSLIERAQFAKDLPLFIADSRGRLMTARRARYIEHLKQVAAQEALAKRDEIPGAAQAGGSSPS